MRVIMMFMLLGIRYFWLQLSSLICLCHLSRGQILAFQSASVYAAPSPISGRARSTPLSTVRVLEREGQTAMPFFQLPVFPNPRSRR